MRVDPRQARELLHRCGSGSLGTVSLTMSGYPFVTLLPYVPDAEARPLFLLSDLAEHTRNLKRDPRASLMVAEPSRVPLEAPRITLLGDAEPVTLAPGAIDRFMRYLPDAASYLSLGDFRFYRLAVSRVRLVGGFARMGWIDAPALTPPVVLPLSRESECVRALAEFVPAQWKVLGVDVEGADLVDEAGDRRRIAFDAALREPAEILEAARSRLHDLAPTD